MSGCDFGDASSYLHNERNLSISERVPIRFFQKQFATDGGCAFRAFNNAIGKPLLNKALIRKFYSTEKNLFQASQETNPDPGNNYALISAQMLERLIRSVGYALKKASAGRTPHEKFEWILKQRTGRFLLFTETDRTKQKRDGHDLLARNVHHWIAVSADEALVIDSLARSLGPQIISESTLSRSVRDGILRIYIIERVRQKRAKTTNE